jgi:hypothetical protein
MLNCSAVCSSMISPAAAGISLGRNDEVFAGALRAPASTSRATPLISIDVGPVTSAVRHVEYDSDRHGDILAAEYGLPALDLGHHDIVCGMGQVRCTPVVQGAIGRGKQLLNTRIDGV